MSSGSTPLYEADCKLLLVEDRSALLAGASPSNDLMLQTLGQSDPISTQIAIIKTRPILADVVGTLWDRRCPRAARAHGRPQGPAEGGGHPQHEPHFRDLPGPGSAEGRRRHQHARARLRGAKPEVESGADGHLKGFHRRPTGNTEGAGSGSGKQDPRFQEEQGDFLPGRRSARTGDRPGPARSRADTARNPAERRPLRRGPSSPQRSTHREPCRTVSMLTGRPPWSRSTARSPASWRSRRTRIARSTT